MFPAQLIGLAIQLSRGQKNGALRTVQPISGSLAFGLEIRRLIIASKTSRDAAPFFLPNTSQASDKGSVENLTNVPPPAMWLCGRLSLNKNGDPGSSPNKGNSTARLPEVHLVHPTTAQKIEPIIIRHSYPQLHRIT